MTPDSDPPRGRGRSLSVLSSGAGEELGLSGNWIAFHQDQGEVFYVGFKDRILTIRARVATGDALLESKQPRWLLREMN